MNKKKNRTNNMNGGRMHKSGPRPDRAVPEGIYCNGTFIHSVASQIGNNVKVETTPGHVYEGIFTTFSPNFEIALELAHLVEPTSPDSLKSSNVYDTMVIKMDDIVHISMENIDLEFATRDGEGHSAFQTDSSISRYNGTGSEEKTLEPWDDLSVCNDEFELEKTGDANGWDVHDMFRTNESTYGVQTTYDDTLDGYTCKIQREDTKDFKAEEAKAAMIAQEIEANMTSQARSALENGDNEEEIFAAVRREEDDESTFSNNAYEDGYKYVHSSKRNKNFHRGFVGRGGHLNNIPGSTNGSHMNLYSNANSSKVQSYNNPNHSGQSYSSNSRASHHGGPPNNHNSLPPRDREMRINGQIQENQNKHHGRPPSVNMRHPGIRGGQRYNNGPDNTGRPQMNNSNNVNRYHYQQHQHQHQHQHHQNQHIHHQPSSHSQPLPPRENRPSEKPTPINNTSSTTPSSVMNNTYAATTTQSRLIPSNNAVGSSQNNNLSSPKSPRVSPPTASAPSVQNHIEYQKHAQKLPPSSSSLTSSTQHQIPPVLHSSSHQSSQQPPPPSVPAATPAATPSQQFVNQTQPQPPQSTATGGGHVPQRKSQTNQGYNQQANHTNRAREDLSDLKKFGSEFNLSSENKTKEMADVSKYQAVQSNVAPKSKSPQTEYTQPVSQHSMQVVQASLVVSQTQPGPPAQQTVALSQPVITHQCISARTQQTVQTPSNVQQQVIQQQQQQQQVIHHHTMQQHQVIQQQQHLQQQQIQQQVIQQLSQQQTHIHYQQAQQVHIQQHHHHQIDQTHQLLVIKAHQAPQQQPQPQLLTQAHLVAHQQVLQQAHIQHSQHQQIAHISQSPPVSPVPSSAYAQSTASSSSSSTVRSTPDIITKDDESENYSNGDENLVETLEKVTTAVKKSNLNPNAKEFIYNPTPKTFTPRSPSTPTHSRPHTPQTPSYTIHPTTTPSIQQMILPTGALVVAQPTYIPAAPTAQTNRIRKVTVGPHRTDYHPSNMQVAAAAATGQPLLAPAATLAQSSLAPATQFAVQSYAPHHHVAASAQSYHHLQMLRGVVPLVPTSISYHHDNTSGTTATAIYVNQASAAAASNVALTHHNPHVHHHLQQQQHAPPSTASSPSQTPQIPSQTHTPNTFQNPTVATQNAPPYQPIMCPVIQAPPHGQPHHMLTQAQAHTVQQYIQHPQVGQQQHHIQLLMPHSNQ